MSDEENKPAGWPRDLKTVQRQADQINEYWRERGKHAGARPYLQGVYGGLKCYGIMSQLINGRPLT